jgi:hypothetical protein
MDLRENPKRNCWLKKSLDGRQRKRPGQKEPETEKP